VCVSRGWTLEAAEAVCEESLALDSAGQLRECRWYPHKESERGIRFRMLESLREYAEEQLSAKSVTLYADACGFLCRGAEEAEARLKGRSRLSG